jgi:hypothetical protein
MNLPGLENLSLCDSYIIHDVRVLGPIVKKKSTTLKDFCERVHICVTDDTRVGTKKKKLSMQKNEIRLG